MEKQMTAYERKLQYNNAYNRENYRSFSIRYDKESEAQIIAWLEEQPSIKAYVTSLIVEDMNEKTPSKKSSKKEKTKEKKASKKSK